MNDLFTQHNPKNSFPENNYFWEYLDFDNSLEQQFQAIDQKAKEIGTTDELVIAFHKHILAVTAMLEGQAMISNDDMREYIDEPAKMLNQTSVKLFEILSKNL